MKKRHMLVGYFAIIFAVSVFATVFQSARAISVTGAVSNNGSSDSTSLNQLQTGLSAAESSKLTPKPSLSSEISATASSFKSQALGAISVTLYVQKSSGGISVFPMKGDASAWTTEIANTTIGSGAATAYTIAKYSTVAQQSDRIAIVIPDTKVVSSTSTAANSTTKPTASAPATIAPSSTSTAATTDSGQISTDGSAISSTGTRSTSTSTSSSSTSANTSTAAPTTAASTPGTSSTSTSTSTAATALTSGSAGLTTTTSDIPANLAKSLPEVKDVKVASEPQKEVTKIETVKNTEVTSANVDQPDKTEKKNAILFSGKAAPNSTIYLYIFSDPIIVSVKADENGNWQYVLDRPLDTGKHESYVVVQDAATQEMVRTEAKTFFISEAQASSNLLDLNGDRTLVVSDPFNALFSKYIMYILFLVAVAVLVLLTFGYMKLRKAKVDETPSVGENKQ